MSYVTEVLVDSPAGYWILDEGSGTAKDYSTNANNATYSGTVQTVGPDGSPATRFTGLVGCYVHATQIAAYVDSDVCTLEAWIKQTVAGGVNRGILSKGQGDGYIRMDATNHVNFERSNVADILATTATIPDTTTWHHIVGTKSGTTTKLYIDGVDGGGIANVSVLATGVGVTIGADWTSSDSEQFFGAIAHAAIYNTALSQARIQAHFNAMSLGPSFIPRRMPLVV